MKIYQGLTIRNVVGREVNVHGIREGVVFWGAYDDKGECLELFRSTLENFSSLVDEAMCAGAAIYTLLRGDSGFGCRAGIRDVVEIEGDS